MKGGGGMQSSFGRAIDYLRVSVTDRCNYRCIYCMAEEGVCKRAHRDILSFEEICEIAAAAVDCGVKKIRLTGGEPLARRGIPALCRMLRSISGLQELTMTTNGALLAPVAKELKAAGVDRLNISIDTLDPGRFAEISRRGQLADALAGLQAARDAGFENTKLNCVLLGGINEEDIVPLADLTKTQPISVRFIELMPMGVCAGWPRERFLSADAVLRRLPALEPLDTDGVARRYRLPGAPGTVGLISPMSHAFCGSCRRLRLTADGKLKPCLHSGEEIPLRGLHGPALKQTLLQAALRKPAAHTMSRCQCSESRRDMNEIGG